MLPFAMRPQQPAPVKAASTVVVFSDLQCPYSAHLYQQLEAMQRRFGSGLRVIVKQSPLPMHPGAPLAHRAALAAQRQGKLDAMTELLYANEAHQGRAELIAYARQLGLNIARFENDLDSPSVKAALAADLAEAQAFGVTKTPTIYANGQRFEGALDDTALAAALQPASTPAAAPVVAAAAVLPPDLTAQLSRNTGTQEGPPAAPVTLVEFTDFQCPFCRQAVEPVKQMLAARGQQVRWVFRAFPLDFHPDAQLAAEAAFAAGAQGKFIEMYDALFAHQSALKLEDLRVYAAQIGLDMPAFDEALRIHRYAGRVAADRTLGMRAGVEGTPAFFLDGEPVSGVRSATELVAWVDAHRDRPALPATAAPVPAETASAPELVVASAPAATSVTLTWFTDVRSALAPAQAGLLQKLTAESHGRLRVVFKPVPFPAHADSALSSAALVAALHQNAFWPVFDAIAARRDTLDSRKLVEIAAALHLNTETFSRDLEAAPADVAASVEDARRRGVLGTPVIFLGERRVDGLQQQGFYETILLDLLGSGNTPALTASAAH